MPPGPRLPLVEMLLVMLIAYAASHVEACAPEARQEARP